MHVLHLIFKSFRNSTIIHFNFSFSFPEAINYKWESLKQKNASFRNRFEVEINTKWNTLLLSLRELIEWVIKKKTEFNVHINSGDLATISKLQNEHLMLRHELENKRPLIENSLLAAKQHIAKNENLILVDFNGNDTFMIH